MDPRLLQVKIERTTARFDSFFSYVVSLKVRYLFQAFLCLSIAHAVAICIFSVKAFPKACGVFHLSHESVSSGLFMFIFATAKTTYIDMNVSS